MRASGAPAPGAAARSDSPGGLSAVLPGGSGGVLPGGSGGVLPHAAALGKDEVGKAAMPDPHGMPAASGEGGIGLEPALTDQPYPAAGGECRPLARYRHRGAGEVAGQDRGLGDPGIAQPREPGRVGRGEQQPPRRVVEHGIAWALAGRQDLRDETRVLQVAGRRPQAELGRQADRRDQREPGHERHAAGGRPGPGRPPRWGAPTQSAGPRTRRPPLSTNRACKKAPLFPGAGRQTAPTRMQPQTSITSVPMTQRTESGFVLPGKKDV